MEFSKKLFIKLAPVLVRKMLPTFLDRSWGPHKFTRAQFAQQCEIATTISRNELQRRLRAFGAGDGENSLFVWHQGRKYFYHAVDQPLAHDESIELYGNIFKASQV